MSRIYPKPPYRNSMNVWYTSALFYEIRFHPQPEDFPDPVFSLYIERPNYICFRTTFVEEGDPTGYKWCMKYLGDWEHWLKLIKVDWFKEAVEHANRELAQKNKAIAIAKIQEIAASDSSQALPAAKYIAEEGWNNKTRGRPSKSEIDATLKATMKAIETEDEDLARIGLKVVGGKSVG